MESKLSKLSKLSRLSHFIVKNSVLLGIAYIHYLVLPSVVPTFGFVVARNITFSYGIEYLTRNKPLVSSRYKEPLEQYPGEFLCYLVKASALEVATTQLMMVSCFKFWPSPWQLVAMIPISFGAEIFFDLLHYIAHRIFHETPYLYRNFHKTHHRHQHVKPILAFYQDQVDLVFSNSLPLLATYYLLRYFFNISHSHIAIMYTYKVFIEVAGHGNKRSYPTSSFPQLVWLPKTLGISLYTEDHNEHHTNPTCNYAKRFSLWDQMFGTRSALIHSY